MNDITFKNGFLPGLLSFLILLMDTLLALVASNMILSFFGLT